MNLTFQAMQVLNEREMQQIWEAALRVWDQVPLRAQGTEEFNEALLDFGCQIDGERMTFPKAVQDKVLARLEQSREGNGPWRPARVDNTKLEYGASGQALYCHDIQTDEIRAATEQDLADWSRLCDCFERLERRHPTFIPQDVPTGSCDVHAFATIMLNSSRPWRVSVYSADMLPYFIELQAIWEGSVEKVKQNPIFAAKCWYNSPFMITRENIEIGMKARELLGQPLTIATMPVAGVATPATIAGALTQITAEVLGCNVISLALDDRLLGYCAGPDVFDMRTGVHTEVGPDCNLLGLGAAQMGAYMFGGEYTARAGPTTAAKLPGAQSMMEKALSATWAICAGIRSFGSLGITAFADIGSAVQLMMDLELMHYFEHLLKGIQVDEDRIGEQTIIAVAPTGARFLGTEHTVRYYREELWSPELLDRRVPMAWVADPQTFLDNARDKARRLLTEAPNRCTLTPQQQAEVRRIVAAADAQVAHTTRA